MDVPDPRRNPRDRQSRFRSYRTNRRCAPSLRNVTRRIASCFFSHLDARTGSPSRNILLVGVLAGLGALVLNYERSAELINFGAFLAFMGVNAAVMRHSFRRAIFRTRSWPLHWSGTAAGRLPVLLSDLAQSFRFRKNCRRPLVCCRICLPSGTDAPHRRRRDCLRYRKYMTPVS